MILTRREKVLPYLLFALSFASFQAYHLFVGSMGIFEAYLAYGLLYGLLLLLFLVFVVGVENAKLSRYGFITFGRKATVATIAMAALLVGIYTLVVFEPGFIFGFTRESNPSVVTFGFFLFSSPLVAVTEEAIYRGYVFRRLVMTSPVTSALLVSSALYALQLTNPFALGGLGLNGAVEYLWVNTFTPFVLGIVMCLYFYKSGWSLLGPVIVRTGLLIQGNLSPFVANTPGFEFSLIFELLGSAALIILINTIVREPRFMARRYLELPTMPKAGRFRRQAQSKIDTKRTLTEVAVVGIIAVSAFAGSQFVLSSSIHLSAIATGSMRPALAVGTLVIVQSVSNPSQIQVGDIVEYNPPTLRGPIVHRVIEINETQSGVLFTTKGMPTPRPTLFRSASAG